MNHVRPMRLAGFLCTLALAAFGQYSVRQEGDIIRLEDARSQTVVSVMPSRGNNAFEMKVKGNNVLQFPFASAAEFKSRGSFSGIPFLAPWANRLDEMAFYANGKKYMLNAGLGNVRGPIPMHGFLPTAP
jgi:aldose 1-epimerase